MTDPVLHCLMCGSDSDPNPPGWLLIHHTLHCERPKCIAACDECKDDMEAVAGPEPEKAKVDKGNNGPYPTITIPDDIIEGAKKERIRKDNMIDNQGGKGAANKGRVTGGRYWIGQLGEYAVKEYAEKNHGVDITMNWEKELMDEYDFDWFAKRVDVKTASRNYYPSPHYSAEVTPQQDKKQFCTHYLFCSYNMRGKAVSIIGWLPRDRWDKLKVLQKQEKGLTDGRFVERWKVNYHYCYPIDSLFGQREKT